MLSLLNVGDEIVFIFIKEMMASKYSFSSNVFKFPKNPIVKRHKYGSKRSTG